MTTEPHSPSLGQLLGSVSADLHTLASQTIALARLEVSAATSALASSAVGLTVSILIAIAGAGVLVSALVLMAVALGLPAWAAATLVGIVLTAGGGLSARYFVGRLRRIELDLRETRDSIKETLEWLKTQSGR
jgi:Putative Actinobacterial Holin-X, holin superfamily III